MDKFESVRWKDEAQASVYRNESCVSSVATFPVAPMEITHTSEDRNFYGSVLHQPPQGHKIANNI